MEFPVSYEMVASTENDIKHEMVCDFRLGLGAGSWHVGGGAWHLYCVAAFIHSCMLGSDS